MTLGYITLEGKVTTAEDPQRGVWYSASADCRYWTDDWNKLGSIGPGIPCCPRCGCVGYQTTYKHWMDKASKYEKEDHPGYVAKMNSWKEHCARTLGS